ncbi:hypothetical protein BU24DRAFT_417303 [Aaosphaeria arxii CBS 175.79]|uniref:Uncharacterized protein n=1 Tax=Aaosphaeria arxii CBS 175.79 TaxID=1450172 RepID=A0A6A5YAQ0_9PLEO|nr:uncharacterized protein BU24DRAFT_417303 [Aaosphaeria arxii CBS 175.79]KAF2021664.1 hypothetical protein BU24DRAFT_417303 [Aaosphaeria arxii CBS 175.79]
MFTSALTRPARTSLSRPAPLLLRLQAASRSISTLPNNPHIYVHQHPIHPNSHILSLLPTTPPTQSLAIGTTTSLPPTPESFTENTEFLEILQSVFKAHASSDPDVRQQAAVFSTPGAGGFSFNTGRSGARGAHQAGRQQESVSRGGWIHISDTRNPPDWGRIAWPEDIFGSVEVDGQGAFVEGDGRYQPSGTYRVVSREGILGIPAFLRGKLVERLQELEKGGK